MNLITGSALQYGVTCILFWGLSSMFETGQVVWTGELIFAMTWLIFVLSIGAVGLLFALLQQGEASRVSSLFFLTPPMTAIVAWALFDETFTLLSLLGLAITVIGVAMVNRK
jgi:drug/metabolite transporter (DMT)-like permease